MRKCAILALLGGCSPAETVPVELEHVSVLSVQTRGMALSGNGDHGHAGMYGVTCDFTTKNALVGSDYDFQGERDTVVDGADLDERGFTTITLSSDRAHVTFLDEGVQPPEDGINVPGVLHGRLVGDRVAVIRQTEEGCEGGFLPLRARDIQQADLVVDLSSEACAPDTSIAVDRDRETLYIATDEGVLVMTPDGVELIEVRADLIAWDPWASALYAAERSGTEVRAYEIDGSQRWAVPVDGEVRDLNHMGENASVLVALRRGRAGALVALDGVNGSVRTDITTPSAAAGVVMSESGRTVGLQLEQETHFYRVHVTE